MDYIFIPLPALVLIPLALWWWAGRSRWDDKTRRTAWQIYVGGSLLAAVTFTVFIGFSWLVVGYIVAGVVAAWFVFTLFDYRHRCGRFTPRATARPVTHADGRQAVVNDVTGKYRVVKAETPAKTDWLAEIGKRV